MKNIFLLLFVFASFSSLYGQDSKFELGIEGGIMWSKTGGEEEIKALEAFNAKPEHKQLGSITGGINFFYHFSESFSLKTGLGYERKGSKVMYKSITLTDNVGNPIGEATPVNKYQFNYITIPALLRWNFHGLFVNAGIYTSILTGQKNIYQGGGIHVQNASNPDIATDNSALYESIDLGLMAGI